MKTVSVGDEINIENRAVQDGFNESCILSFIKVEITPMRRGSHSAIF